jgi:hypothetical protein
MDLLVVVGGWRKDRGGCGGGGLRWNYYYIWREIGDSTRIPYTTWHRFATRSRSTHLLISLNVADDPVRAGWRMEESRGVGMQFA